VQEPSREHRLRVLRHQARLAAERDTAQPGPGHPQLQMPLIVEVAATTVKKTRLRRARRTLAADQPGLDNV
jgi:hypothetical protein